VVRWFGANVSGRIARERLAAKETKHSGDSEKMRFLTDYYYCFRCSD
jgi:hypothetical protein